MTTETADGLLDLSNTSFSSLETLDDDDFAASLAWITGRGCGGGTDRLWQLNGVQQEDETL
jgi:hypothetical protein